MAFSIPDQKELSPAIPPSIERVRRPEYGRWLDDFEPGAVSIHPRGYSFERSEMRAFATTFMQTNPLYLNREYARAHGFADIPASPQMVFNVLLSLGVQNNSEKAMANLGYYGMRFLRPVYAGDTLCAQTQVVGRKDRGADKPGIVHIRTVGVNQRQEVVAQYERKIMVRHRPANASPSQAATVATGTFPWQQEPRFEFGFCVAPEMRQLTGAASYFEDFQPGEIIVHCNGRTISDEHLPWTYRVGNTHPLHYDAVYSRGLSGQMSGDPIVYGGLVFAWLEGLASRDVSENALWELGFSEGYHTQPAVSGDTVAALTRVLACEAAPAAVGVPCGVVTMQLVGVKNISAHEALETHGTELFIKEGDKKALGKAKLPAKIFEIERQLLIKRRPVEG